MDKPSMSRLIQRPQLHVTTCVSVYCWHRTCLLPRASTVQAYANFFELQLQLTGEDLFPNAISSVCRECAVGPPFLGACENFARRRSSPYIDCIQEMAVEDINTISKYQYQESLCVFFFIWRRGGGASSAKHTLLYACLN